MLRRGLPDDGSRLLDLLPAGSYDEPVPPRPAPSLPCALRLRECGQPARASARRRGVSANAVTERIVRKALGEVGSGGRGNPAPGSPAPGNRRNPAPGNPATVTSRHEPRRTEPRACRAERRRSWRWSADTS